jgi:large subunit ribosomal protein L18
MNQQRIRRQNRIRKQIKVVSDRPRLSVYRSNKYLYAQIIDDKTGKTVAGVSEKTVKVAGTPVERAKTLGMEIAKIAKEKKVTSIVFDKGRYTYHGRVKALAEGAREGGLSF